MVTPQGKREAVAYMEKAHHVSERRACRMLVQMRGKPKVIVSDNGPELTSCAVLIWASERGISTGTTSSPASRSRTVILKASTIKSVTSA